MSMMTSIVGFKPPNKKWQEMKTIWDACEKAGIDIPIKVYDFFEGIPPDSAGVEVDLKVHSCCRDYQEEMRNGYETKVDKLPKDVKIIRFWNSYCIRNRKNG